MFNKKVLYKLVMVMAIMLLFSTVSTAQCAMCRATVGSNLSEGRGVIGTGLNFGILYLLLTPYVLIGSLAFVWFKTSKKELNEKLSLANRIKSIYKK
ncbi:MAG: hypothetical protein ACI8UX_001677 [Psychromonas sp.]|jgi:hypothetical protein